MRVVGRELLVSMSLFLAGMEKSELGNQQELGLVKLVGIPLWNPRSSYVDNTPLLKNNLSICMVSNFASRISSSLPNTTGEKNFELV